MVERLWARGRRPGFTLVELLTVLGLIALLVALFLPVMGKMRSAAGAATCLSNLRQIGTAWTMRMAEDNGRLIDYVWHTPDMPEVAWGGYWLGAAEKYGARGAALLCPVARDPAPAARRRGYGSAHAAWTGEYENYGSAVRYNADTFRVSSYGFNRYLTAGGGMGPGGRAAYLSDVAGAANVPAFFDCTFADARPLNGTAATPVQAPPDLGGGASEPGKPEHWKFLLARHGRGINVCTADGAARWVPVEDLYQLTWKADWVPYRLDLPRR